MVPAFFAFRSDYQSLSKADVIGGLNELKNTSAGSQVLTLFQSEDIADYPAAILDSALELIEPHELLLREDPSP